jgi:hypothetical protein
MDYDNNCVLSASDLRTLAAPFEEYAADECDPWTMTKALHLIRRRLSECTPDTVKDWPDDELWTAPQLLFPLIPTFMAWGSADEAHEIVKAQSAVQRELGRLAVVGVIDPDSLVEAGSEVQRSLHA